MLKEFYLGISDENERSFYLKHIQYNIFKRLSKVKVVPFKRIDISISSIERDFIAFKDSRRIEINIEVPEDVLKSIDHPHSIETIYDHIFKGLKSVFSQNELEIEILDQAHKQTKKKISLQLINTVKIFLYLEED